MGCIYIRDRYWVRVRDEVRVRGDDRVRGSSGDAVVDTPKKTKNKCTTTVTSYALFCKH